MFLSRKVGSLCKIRQVYLARRNGYLDTLLHERHQMLLVTPDSEALGAFCEEATGHVHVLRLDALKVNTFNGNT